MKILVTGDRAWDNIELVVEVLSKYEKGTVLINGKCRGADNICAAVAEQLGFTVRSYPALWDAHGRAAGPIRNQQMLDKENKPDEPIDICLAFHDNIEASKGTKDMMARAKKANIPVVLFTTEQISQK